MEIAVNTRTTRNMEQGIEIPVPGRIDSVILNVKRRMETCQ